MQQKEKPKNAVIYIRVSSKSQVDNFSLESQEKTSKEYCARMELSVLKTFIGAGESAKTLDRKIFQEMMRYCETHRKQISTVVVFRVDRFSRATADYLAMKSVLRKWGISLVSATEAFDNSPLGTFVETIAAAQGQMENEIRGEKTIIGMRTRALNGLWPGIASWGYINSKDKTIDKLILPHPDRASIVHLLMEKRATGKYSYKELSNMVNKLGHTTRHGLKMTKQLVAKIIKNPIYCGIITIPKLGVYNISGKHQAIVSVELFERANGLRRNNARRKLPRSRDNKDYPLRGIICGGCGGSLSGGPSKGKMGKIYQYYSCIKGDCEKRRSIKKDDLENDLTSFLVELTPNNDFFDGLIEAVKLAHKKEISYVMTSEKRIQNQILGLETKKEQLLDLKLSGGMSNKDFITHNEKFNSKIKDLEKELSESASPELGVENVVESGVEFLKNLPENWKELDVKDLRVLRELLFGENLIYNYPGIKTPKVCCIYNIKSEFLDEKNRFVTLRRVELRFQP